VSFPGASCLERLGGSQERSARGQKIINQKDLSSYDPLAIFSESEFYRVGISLLQGEFGLVLVPGIAWRHAGQDLNGQNPCLAGDFGVACYPKRYFLGRAAAQSPCAIQALGDGDDEVRAGFAQKLRYSRVCFQDFVIKDRTVACLPAAKDAVALAHKKIGR
jgi:hypothetical protein